MSFYSGHIPEPVIPSEFDVRMEALGVHKCSGGHGETYFYGLTNFYPRGRIVEAYCDRPRTYETDVEFDAAVKAITGRV